MIHILSKEVVNKIAAGEVVERPASVVKELIENSIDAGSTEIRIIIEEFGTKKIQIIDNGSGISKSDLDKLFHKHATSKINNINDLEKILSYGFRGEALATISSVSEIILETKNVDDEYGTYCEFIEGKFKNIKPSSITSGTNISVNNLFENIPARKKFLKTKTSENRVILETIYKYLLVNPQISFEINIDGVLKNYPRTDLKERISKVLAIDADNLIEVHNDSNIRVKGFVLHPKVFLKTRNYQHSFVNKRPVTDGTIAKAVIDGYDTFLMKNQYAGFVLFIELPPIEVDVNVHPRKTEVRFTNSGEIYRSIRFSVNKALLRNLREETRSKLTVNDEKSFDQENSINDNSQKYDNATDSVAIETSEFEDFLKSPVKSTTNYSKPSKYITKQAIEFNHEVSLINPVDDTKGKISLDTENATQLLNAYIVTSNHEGLLIIDQHAASERFFYEKYLHQIKSGKIQSKLLLTPEIIDFNDFETNELEARRDVFSTLGFEFEIFGKNQVRVLSVPSFVKMDNFLRIFHLMAQEILNYGEVTNAIDKLYHEISATLACHTAVRFGDKLNKQEIIQILKNLMLCEDPYNCPHGRPIIQDFSRYDIEKKFKRCRI